MNNYSLCIPAIDGYTKELKNKAWRIADYDIDQECLVHGRYSEKEERGNGEEYLPYQIGMGINNINEYKAHIRKWEYEGSYSTKSSIYNINPIEIISVESIDLSIFNRDEDLREILYEGIEIPEYIEGDFFLVINKSSNEYEVILCNKNDFVQYDINKYKIEKYCLDMLKVKHKFKVFIITSYEIIDTEHCKIYNRDGNIEKTRYFYKFFTYQMKTREIVLRKPEYYLKAYISKYLRNKKDILSNTNKERKKCVELINYALDDIEEVDLFLKETGFKENEIREAFSSFSSEFLELYFSKDILSKIIEENIFNYPEILELNLEKGKELWIQENEQIKIEKEFELIELKEKLLELEVDKKNNEEILIKQLENLEGTKDKNIKLIEENKKLETKLVDLEDEINNKIVEFKEDIISLATSTLGIEKNYSNEDKLLTFSENSKKRQIEVEISELIEFSDELESNLESYGMNEEYSYDFAIYILSIIIQKQSIIVCGKNANNIANAISYLIDKNAAKQIILPNGYKNIYDLVNKLNSNKSNVILIHNALDSFDDNVFLTISKLCKEKIILFSSEDYQSYRKTPKYWNNYGTCIYTEEIWNYGNQIDGISVSNINMDILYENKIKKNKNLEDKKIIKFLKEINLSNSTLNLFLENYKYVYSIDENFNEKSLPLIENIVLISKSSIKERENLICNLKEKDLIDEKMMYLLKDEFSFEY